MKKIGYKTFSLRTHRANSSMEKSNVCQFELTFRCGLHCKYCYTDCYNKPGYLKKELKTEEVKIILDKVYRRGAIWLCFTGGDPLTRRDFLDIYSYAKNKGFIITIFTSGYSINKKIIGYLKKMPPFAIEITLNAVTEDLYEKISQVKGSFSRTMKGVNLIIKEKLPLKIKTQVLRDNLAEIPRIQKFVEGLGLKFLPRGDLHARLNGDTAPCSLRVLPQEFLNPNGDVKTDCSNEPNEHDKLNYSNGYLFRCTVGSGDGINVDPYGNMFLCNLIRKPAFNLLKADVGYAAGKLLPLVRNRKFVSNSKCKGCSLRELCHWCSAKACLETGDEEAPISYYCKSAGYIAACG